MAKIWLILMLVSSLFALAGGQAGTAAEGILSSGGQAVSLLITLLGTMPLWSGLMEILSATGDTARLGRLFRRILRPLFPGLQDDAAWDALSMNLAANLLGLGNAATPAGIEAAKRLSALGEPGLQALAMLLVLDNTGMQLIPTTVITLRQSAGARDPADIWGMTLLISGMAMIIAAALMLLIRRGGDGRAGNIRGSSGDRCGAHPAQRLDVTL